MIPLVVGLAVGYTAFGVGYLAGDAVIVARTDRGLTPWHRCSKRRWAMALGWPALILADILAPLDPR